jgi:hypothetical protein
LKDVDPGMETGRQGSLRATLQMSCLRRERRTQIICYRGDSRDQAGLRGEPLEGEKNALLLGDSLLPS